MRQILSPTLWADVWATYSLLDGSFSDRRTFGFNADVVNGFFTPVPTLILYWVRCALLGLCVSVRLILDGNYGVLGH